MNFSMPAALSAALRFELPIPSLEPEASMQTPMDLGFSSLPNAFSASMPMPMNLGLSSLPNEFSAAPAPPPAAPPGPPAMPSTMPTPRPPAPAPPPPGPMSQQFVPPPMPLPGASMPRAAFAGFSLNPAAPVAQPQKDNDSVQSMLMRLQGNLQQTKQAMSVQQALTAVPQQAPLGIAAGATGMLSGVVATMQSEARLVPSAEWDGGLEQRVATASTPQEIEEVGKAVLTKFPTLPPEQIAELLRKMDRMIGMYHGEFLSELSRLLASRLRECSSTQFATLLSSFLMWSLDTRERFSEFAKDFATTAYAELPARLMEMAPHELNCCLAGFLCLGFSDQKFFTAVSRSVVARHKTFGLSQLTALLAVLAEMRLVQVDLFTSAAQVVCSRMRELRPAEILRLLRAFAKCNVQHETLCHAISLDILGRFKDGGANAGFRVEDLCEVAWMMCILQSYNQELFALVFRQLEQAPQVGTDALCMIYECHLALDAECKDMYSKIRIPADKVQALVELYKQNRKTARRCSEHLLSDVTTVLKSLVEGTVQPDHRTSIGLLTDVAALRKRTSTDAYIHIDIDTPLSVVRPLEGDDSAAPAMLDGSVAFRRRLMQKHNLRLIAVKESDWRRLEGSKEKRRHLRTLLASLGDVLE
mmetsp:Transcript_1738/g.4371  ORF Transcript_1738/g.4371 Transcript_1738/m.4371 type:complete len:644 (+) Transcript_1738:1-1932(+)